jgi:hypothetical protein
VFGRIVVGNTTIVPLNRQVGEKCCIFYNNIGFWTGIVRRMLYYVQDFTKSSKYSPHSPTVWGYFTYTAAALHSVYVNLQVSKYSSPIVVKKVVKK